MHRPSLRSALIAAGLVVAGSTGTALIAAGQDAPPALNGSCISPLSVLQATQAAEGTYNGITVNGRWVPIENGLTEPQVYASTEGCAPDGSGASVTTLPPTTVAPPTTSVTTLPPTTVAPTTTTPPTTVPPSTTTTVAPTTTTTVIPTTTTTAMHRHLVCHIDHDGHRWHLRCHWVWS